MFSGLRRGVTSFGFAVAFGLAACGGGGSGTTPPPADAPTVALQIQPIKVFRFTWTDVSDATEYRLQEDADSASGYTQVATIATGVGRYDLVVSLHNPTWLDFSESFPLITEISHTIYNYYNPTAPIETDREPFIVPVDDCKVAGSPIIDELTSGSFTN